MIVSGFKSLKNPIPPDLRAKCLACNILSTVNLFDACVRWPRIRRLGASRARGSGSSGGRTRAGAQRWACLHADLTFSIGQEASRRHTTAAAAAAAAASPLASAPRLVAAVPTELLSARHRQSDRHRAGERGSVRHALVVCGTCGALVCPVPTGSAAAVCVSSGQLGRRCLALGGSARHSLPQGEGHRRGRPLGVPQK